MRYRSSRRYLALAALALAAVCLVDGAPPRRRFLLCRAVSMKRAYVGLVPLRGTTVRVHLVLRICPASIPPEAARRWQTPRNDANQRSSSDYRFTFSHQ